MKTLLIVPAYNESANIVEVVHTIQRAGYDYVVINDGSKDDTAKICRKEGFNFLDLSQNLGIGGAVQTGHRYAHDHGYDIDVQFDGDGQHDISYVPALIEGIEKGNDLVIGSRFLEETEGFQSTTMRRAGIRWLSHCIHHTCGLNITDATSGFRACNRRAIDLFCGYYPSDYPEPESIVYAHKSGLNVGEVPVVMHERQGGKSSIAGLSSAYYMIKVTLAIEIVGFARRNPR
jgi:glycosyltransferase involved in cell wall biosynthesis